MQECLPGFVCGTSFSCLTASCSRQKKEHNEIVMFLSYAVSFFFFLIKKDCMYTFQKKKKLIFYCFMQLLWKEAKWLLANRLSSKESATKLWTSVVLHMASRKWLQLILVGAMHTY